MSDDIDYSRQFTEKDNIWKECTNVFASNIRTKGFKVFSNMFLAKMLHYFPCHKVNDVQYYHVIEDSMVTPMGPGSYYYMTEEELFEKYDKLIFE